MASQTAATGEQTQGINVRREQSVAHNVTFTPLTLQHPSDDDFARILLGGLNTEGRNIAQSGNGQVYGVMMRTILNHVINITNEYQRINNTRILNYIDEVAETLASTIPDEAQIEGRIALSATLRNLRSELDLGNQATANVLHQIQQIPASAGSSSRQPKIGEPPKFSGADKKSNGLKEWLQQLGLWIAHEGIVTDHQKIVTALSRLEGPAAKYMSHYYDKVESGENTGTWAMFKDELRSIYGQRDDKEGAKKELTSLFENKSLAHKDFIKYAERFRTLARIAGYESSLLIEKLHDVLQSDLKVCLIGYGKDRQPDDWSQYLDLLLLFYKELHPEKAQGAIFGSGSGGSKDNDVPMEVDRAEKKKGKGKGKEVNSTEKSKKYCAIHKSRGHSTEDCRLNGKNSSAEKDEKKEKKSDERSSQKKSTTNEKARRPSDKKVRAVEADSDDDSDAPRASSSKQKINHVRYESTARIEELSEDDEPPSRPSTSPKPFDPADFLRRYL